MALEICLAIYGSYQIFYIIILYILKIMGNTPDKMYEFNSIKLYVRCQMFSSVVISLSNSEKYN